MSPRRWLSTLLIVLGLLCGAAVLLAGAVATIRLAMLAPGANPKSPIGAPATADHPKSDSPHPGPLPEGEGGKSSAKPPGADTDPRRRFAPEPFDSETAAAPPAVPERRPMDRPAPLPNLSQLERQTGTLFGPELADPFRRPELVEIVVPNTIGSDAIWGGIGRDSRGQIWYGVCENWGDTPSAHLFQLDPETCASTDRGNVVDQLNRLGLAGKGVRQPKIHSKIVEAEDGNLYFTSMDEPEVSKLPTIASHLWRLRRSEAAKTPLPSRERPREGRAGSEASPSPNPSLTGRGVPRPPADEYRWEHLAAVEPALIAVGTSGRWVYALGYSAEEASGVYKPPAAERNLSLYQYDIRSSKLNVVGVPSVPDHISRNLPVDAQGHAYVPRLRAVQAAIGATPDPHPAPPQATLVEFDTELKEIGQTPLEHYLDPSQPPAASHGIVSFAHLADGSIVFATHVGYLYRIVPGRDAPATVSPLGWFWPEGPAYIATMFTFSGSRYIAGVGFPPKQDLHWLVYDLQSGRSQARRLAFVDLFDPPRQHIGLYGSETRDFRGRFYIAGRFGTEKGSTPLLMRIEAGDK